VIKQWAEDEEPVKYDAEGKFTQEWIDWYMPKAKEIEEAKNRAPVAKPPPSPLAYVVGVAGFCALLAVLIAL
jgi:hypothetical protein